MDWNTCFSGESLASATYKKDGRSNFQKDYDRIIFSSSFRRLQNKTQVFPLPGTTFVHNRLTHSLEVASVGRSLGEVVGNQLIANHGGSLHKEAIDFYTKDLAYVVSAACLAHDIGNPAFGHSGEEAISNFFKVNEDLKIEGVSLRSRFSDAEWEDVTHFEGNANALRVLTQEFAGKSPTGLGITVTTLAALLKYPCSSSARSSKIKHRKKFGYFQSEADIFQKLADKANLLPDFEDHTFKRHPFVYLVEAADDICYSIIDMEDAHRIGILSHELVRDIFLDLILKLDVAEVNADKTKATYHRILDPNEAIAYLRAKCISALIIAAVEEFNQHSGEIINGTFNSSLIDEIEKKTNSMEALNEVSLHRIYRHSSVLEIEIAGFHVMSELLNIFIPAALKSKKSQLDKTIIRLIPAQFQSNINDEKPYLRVMNVLDHISGMTDAYATEMYRKLKGIEISRII